MSALPQAVQRQADEAAAIEEQLRATQADAGGTNDPAPNLTPAADEAPAAPTPPQQPQPEDPTWQQRFLTLQGKYNAEAARANEAQRGLQAQVDELRAKLEQKPVEPPKPVVSDEDKRTYGEDLLETVDRIAKARTAELEAQLAARDQRISQLETHVGQVANSVNETDFFGQLTRAMPEWEQINVDPDFVHRWLKEADPLTGVSRMAVLQNHVTAKDVERTLNVFRIYRDSVRPAQPQPNPLAQQVAPSRDSSAGSTPAPAAARIWTQRDIAQFYEDARRGNIKPDDAVRMEADIMTAVAEGRVR